ncbi:MAG: hypothetical protein JWN13_4866 [Betaproteobacteria bacterium]|jgi:hypothetical protein|nr:hypothetical protein [Betaproteobacteria bacterium]MEA3152918.1 hypothetical protein [Betaproteobacteria bacterium]
MLKSLAAVSGTVCAIGAVAQTLDVPSELWDRPRTGRAVLEQHNVKQAVVGALAKPESQLVIHHGPGQEPLLQAEELRSWLAALAIDPRRIDLRGDLTANAPLRIEVIP